MENNNLDPTSTMDHTRITPNPYLVDYTTLESIPPPLPPAVAKDNRFKKIVIPSRIRGN